MPSITRCRYCSGSIIWLKNIKSDKYVPVESDECEYDDLYFEANRHVVHHCAVRTQRPVTGVLGIGRKV